MFWEYDPDGLLRAERDRLDGGADAGPNLYRQRGAPDIVAGAVAHLLTAMSDQVLLEHP